MAAVKWLFDVHPSFTEPPMKRRSWAGVAFSGALAGCWGLSPAPAAPPLDKNAPARTETATFALG